MENAYLWTLQLKFTNFTNTLIEASWPVFISEAQCNAVKTILIHLLEQNGAHDFVISTCTYIGS